MSDTDGGGSTGSGELASWLLTEGLPWVTTAEIVRGASRPAGRACGTAAALDSEGFVVHSDEGGYVPIPSQYRVWGTVPGSELIDAMRLACRGRGGAPRATSGGPDWDGIAQVALQSFVEPVDTVLGFVRVIDGHYFGAEFTPHAQVSRGLAHRCRRPIRRRPL